MLTATYKATADRRDLIAGRQDELQTFHERRNLWVILGFLPQLGQIFQLILCLGLVSGLNINLCKVQPYVCIGRLNFKSSGQQLNCARCLSLFSQQASQGVHDIWLVGC